LLRELKESPFVFRQFRYERQREFSFVSYFGDSVMC
jgi:hypothetical protein